MSGIFDPGAAAAKNNANQQAAAVQNAQQAWQTAATNFNGWNAQNPSPVANAAIQTPGQQASPTAQAIMNAPAVMGKPQIMGQLQAQPQARPMPAQGQQQRPQGMPQRPAQVNPQVVQAILGAT